MSNKDIKILIDLAEEKLQQNMSKEEALQSLIDAGIIDNQGKPTQPYVELANDE